MPACNRQDEEKKFYNDHDDQLAILCWDAAQDWLV